MKKKIGIVLGVFLVLALASAPVAAANMNPPASSVKTVFIHHSTGENWLSDSNGGLGMALRDNKYFVSDTNYGWGSELAASRGGEPIGSTTDIGDWYTWFRGANSASYMDTLYLEAGQNSSYSRIATDPGGANEIVMFKSCFPNSELGGPATPVPPIDSNGLKGQDCYSSDHTVANAKGIYNDLLNYFEAHQEKLFIVVAAPPVSGSGNSSNARTFNNWLFNDWLIGYAHNNVFVFDFYNTLTTNGGDANTSDLLGTAGNHHRVVHGGWIQHKVDGDNDSNGNVLEYPSGDDHPSQAGNWKAAAEFVPLLNYAYNRWKGIVGTDTVDPTTLAPSSATVVRGGYATLFYRVNDNISPDAVVTVKIKRSGTFVKTYRLGLRRTNRQVYTRIRVWLAAGTYYFCIYGTDESGNPQSNVAYNRMYVR